jgi:glycosyltransferase involved in cell wall biosynthesis
MPVKEAGKLRILFLSRICRVKNLAGALTMLQGLEGDVEFNIYGPLEDAEYWEECQRVIGRLPQKVQVRYCGAIPHDQVHAVMREHDLFILPSLGESFGQVIAEALRAGCLVLISDRTPWRGLEAAGVGWMLPLDQPEAFQSVLQRCLEMTPEEHLLWSRRATEYAAHAIRAEQSVEQNRAMFGTAVSPDRQSRRSQTGKAPAAPTRSHEPGTGSRSQAT